MLNLPVSYGKHSDKKSLNLAINIFKKSSDTKNYRFTWEFTGKNFNIGIYCSKFLDLPVMVNVHQKKLQKNKGLVVFFFILK